MGWTCYDDRLEALLSMGTVGVAESLLRLLVRILAGHAGAGYRMLHQGTPALQGQVHCSNMDSDARAPLCINVLGRAERRRRCLCNGPPRWGTVCRRHCLHTRYCTILGRGAGRRRPWGCSSPSASGSFGCALAQKYGRPAAASPAAATACSVSSLVGNRQPRQASGGTPDYPCVADLPDVLAWSRR